MAFNLAVGVDIEATKKFVLQKILITNSAYGTHSHLASYFVNILLKESKCHYTTRIFKASDKLNNPFQF